MKKLATLIIIMMIITLPAYAADVMAGYGVEVDSASGVDGFYEDISVHTGGHLGYQRYTDNVSIVLNVDSDEPLNRTNVMIQRGTGSWFPMDECSGSSCTLNRMLTSSEMVQYNVVVKNNDGDNKATSSFKLIPDYSAPTIEDFSVEPYISNDGNFSLQYKVNDLAYSGNSNCVGLLGIEFTENDEVIKTIEPSALSCSLDGSINYKSSIDEGIVTFCMVASDRFQQTSEQICHTGFIDRTAPVASNLTITDNSGDILSYVSSNKAESATVQVVFDNTDVDQDDVFADLSVITGNSGLVNPSCYAIRGNTICRWNIMVDINSSTVPTIPLTFSDIYGNEGEMELTGTTISIDDDGPSFRTLTTGYGSLSDGSYEVRKVTNFSVTIAERDLGSSMPYLDLSAIGGSDALLADDCEKTGSIYTCYWNDFDTPMMSTDISEKYTIKAFGIEDDLGNPASENITSQVTLDTIPPIVSSLDSRLIDGLHNKTTKGGSLQLKLYVMDEGTVISAGANLSNLYNYTDYKPGVCKKVSSVSVNPDEIVTSDCMVSSLDIVDTGATQKETVENILSYISGLEQAEGDDLTRNVTEIENIYGSHDAALLFQSIAKAKGIATRFVETIGSDCNVPDSIMDVRAFIDVLIDNTWVRVDPLKGNFLGDGICCTGYTGDCYYADKCYELIDRYAEPYYFADSCGMDAIKSKVRNSCSMGDYNIFECTWDTDPISTDDIGDIAVSFDVKDEVGNTLNYDDSVFVYGIIPEGEYWTNTVKCSPELIDRQVTEMINYRSYCSVELKSDDGVEALETTMGTCTVADNGSKYIQDITMEEGPIIRFELKATKMDIDNLKINCPLNIISEIQNSYVTQEYEVENVSIQLNFYNLPIGEYSEVKKDKIREVQTDSFVAAEWVGKLKHFIDILDKICSILSFMQEIDSAILNVEFLLGTIDYNPYTAGPYRVTSEASQELGDTNQKFLSTFDRYCKYLSCDLTLWDAFDSTSKLDPYQKLTDYVDKNMDAYNDWEIGNFNMTAEAWPKNPRESIVLSVASLCIPGILDHIERWRQIQCNYGLCLVNSMEMNMPESVCDDQKDYLECKYFWGEAFRLVPFVSFIKQKLGQLRQIMSDPVGMVFAGWGYLCRPYLGLPGTPHYACWVPKVIMQWTSIVNDIVTYVEQDWGEWFKGNTMDTCEEFDTRLDEVGMGGIGDDGGDEE